MWGCRPKELGLDKVKIGLEYHIGGNVGLGWRRLNLRVGVVFYAWERKMRRSGAREMGFWGDEEDVRE